MLKKRIIPIMLWSQGRLVKTVNFTSPRIVGNPVRAARVYSDQDADEIFVLNIDKGSTADPSFLENVRWLSEETMMPISVGGGITSLRTAANLFDAGADKIVVNSTNYTSPHVLVQIVNHFGSQAVTAGIDFKRIRSRIALFSQGGQVLEKTSLDQHLRNLLNSGIGEIFIQSIDRDGARTGYDLEATAQVLNQTSVPVIVAGGAGTLDHLLDAFKLGVDAVACGSLFNFGDNSPIRAKAYLRNHQVPLKVAQ